MAIKIGTISISLSAETASFQNDMTRASQIAMNSSKNIERSFNLMAGAITAATGAAVVSLGYLIDKTEDTVFSMQKMAQQAGVSVEQFSKFALAAKYAGMPMEQMAVLMTRVARSSYESQAGNKQAAAAYDALKVKVIDANGHFKTADQIMLEVAKKLDRLKESAGKTAIETVLMGRSGAQAAALMDVLANRFDEVSATALRLGVVFGDETAEGARKLHENMINIQEAAFGLAVHLLTKLSPALNDVANKLIDVATNKDTLKQLEDIASDIAAAVKLAGEAFGFVADHAKTFMHIVEGLIALRIAGIFLPMVLSASEATGLMGKLGTAILKMTSSALGVRKLTDNIIGLAKETSGLNDTVRLAKQLAGENAAALLTEAEAAQVAKVQMTALAGAIGLATLGIGIFAQGVYEEFTKANEIAGQSTTWADKWHGAIDVLKEDLHDLMALVYDIETGNFARIKQDMQWTSLGEAIGNEAKKRIGPQQPTKPTVKGKDDKGDAPPPPGTEKVDELAKKLQVLKDAADQARQAYADVFKSPGDQRRDDAAGKAKKFIDENEQLFKGKWKGQEKNVQSQVEHLYYLHLTYEAQQKLAQSMREANAQSEISTDEHLKMAAAMGKSAQAMQDATIAAKVNSEMSKFDPNWQSNIDLIAAARRREIELRKEANAVNAATDAQTATTTRLELESQERLNSAIFAGAEARRLAALENEKAQIRAEFASRGDTGSAAEAAQLAAAEKRSELANEAADREKAYSLDSALHYREQLQAIQDAADAAVRAGHAMDQRVILEANKQAWLQYKEASDKAILATGSGVDGLRVALDQLGRDTESAAQKMHDAFLQTLDDLNNVLSKLMTEHHQRGDHAVRNAFSGFARGEGQKMANAGLKKAESAVAGHFGYGKPDGSKNKPFWVKLDDEIKKLLGMGQNQADYQQGAKQGANELAQLLANGGDATGDSSSGNGNSGSGAGGIVSTILGAMIQGAFADGTDSLIPGVPAIVGEKGPELFVPPSSGAIIPNHKLGGVAGGHHIYIDARGSNDPAQTTALIHEYMKKAAPQIVQHTVKTVHEQRLRSPATAPGR